MDLNESQSDDRSLKEIHKNEELINEEKRKDLKDKVSTKELIGVKSKDEIENKNLSNLVEKSNKDVVQNKNYLEKNLENSLEKNLEKSLEKNLDKNLDKCLEKNLEKSSDKNLEKNQEKNSETKKLLFEYNKTKNDDTKSQDCQKQTNQIDKIKVDESNSSKNVSIDKFFKVINFNAVINEDKSNGDLSNETVSNSLSNQETQKKITPAVTTTTSISKPIPISVQSNSTLFPNLTQGISVSKVIAQPIKPIAITQQSPILTSSTGSSFSTFKLTNTVSNLLNNKNSSFKPVVTKPNLANLVSPLNSTKPVSTSSTINITKPITTPKCTSSPINSSNSSSSNQSSNNKNNTANTANTSKTYSRMVSPILNLNQFNLNPNLIKNNLTNLSSSVIEKIKVPSFIKSSPQPSKPHSNQTVASISTLMSKQPAKQNQNQNLKEDEANQQNKKPVEESKINHDASKKLNGNVDKPVAQFNNFKQTSTAILQANQKNIRRISPPPIFWHKHNHLIDQVVITDVKSDDISITIRESKTPQDFFKQKTGIKKKKSLNKKLIVLD